MFEVSRPSDVSRHSQLESEVFFKTYKLLENRETTILGWENASMAWQLIERARAAFESRKATPQR